MLPTTNPKNLKITFTGGNIYNANMAGASLNLTANLSMIAGGSYVIDVRLKPNILYLISDGSTGNYISCVFGYLPASHDFSNDGKFYASLIKLAFEQVGGQAPKGHYYSSSEIDQLDDYCPIISDNYFSPNYVNGGQHIRPFIHY